MNGLEVLSLDSTHETKWATEFNGIDDRNERAFLCLSWMFVSQDVRKPFDLWVRDKTREDGPNKEQVVTERTSSLSFIPCFLSLSFIWREIHRYQGRRTTDTTRKKVWTTDRDEANGRKGNWRSWRSCVCLTGSNYWGYSLNVSTSFKYYLNNRERGVRMKQQDREGGGEGRQYTVRQQVKQVNLQAKARE